MIARIITLAVLLWIVVPVRAYSQKDSLNYQLRLGGELGFFSRHGLTYYLTCTGAWHPSYVPLRLEVMAGAGYIQDDSNEGLYLLRAGISILLTRATGLNIAATIVKPAVRKLIIEGWYSNLIGGTMEISEITDGSCVELGLTYTTTYSLQYSFFLRQSLKDIIRNQYAAGRFVQYGFGLAYIYEW